MLNMRQQHIAVQTGAPGLRPTAPSVPAQDSAVVRRLLASATAQQADLVIPSR
jgi:hypothetical protein